MTVDRLGGMTGSLQEAHHTSYLRDYDYEQPPRRFPTMTSARSSFLADFDAAVSATRDAVQESFSTDTTSPDAMAKKAKEALIKSLMGSVEIYADAAAKEMVMECIAARFFNTPSVSSLSPVATAFSSTPSSSSSSGDHTKLSSKYTCANIFFMMRRLLKDGSAVIRVTKCTDELIEMDIAHRTPSSCANKYSIKVTMDGTVVVFETTFLNNIDPLYIAASDFPEVCERLVKFICELLNYRLETDGATTHGMVSIEYDDVQVAIVDDGGNFILMDKESVGIKWAKRADPLSSPSSVAAPSDTIGVIVAMLDAKRLHIDEHSDTTTASMIIVQRDRDSVTVDWRCIDQKNKVIIGKSNIKVSVNGETITFATPFLSDPPSLSTVDVDFLVKCKRLVHFICDVVQFRLSSPSQTVPNMYTRFEYDATHMAIVGGAGDFTLIDKEKISTKQADPLPTLSSPASSPVSVTLPSDMISAIIGLMKAACNRINHMRTNHFFPGTSLVIVHRDRDSVTVEWRLTCSILMSCCQSNIRVSVNGETISFVTPFLRGLPFLRTTDVDFSEKCKHLVHFICDVVQFRLDSPVCTAHMYTSFEYDATHKAIVGGVGDFTLMAKTVYNSLEKIAGVSFSSLIMSSFSSALEAIKAEDRPVFDISTSTKVLTSTKGSIAMTLSSTTTTEELLFTAVESDKETVTLSASFLVQKHTVAIRDIFNNEPSFQDYMKFMIRVALLRLKSTAHLKMPMWCIDYNANQMAIFGKDGTYILKPKSELHHSRTITHNV